MNYTSNIPSTTVAPNMIPNYKACALEHYLRKNSITNFPKPDIMKADSGASKTYIKENHKKYLQDQIILKNGPRATLPNNSTIQATISGQLPLHPSLKHKTLLFSELQSESLLFIGQLCDEGCITIFDDKLPKIYKNNKDIQQFL